jgi:hypothetical protein
MIVNPRETIERLLLEFNKTIPQLTFRQSVRFQLILLDRMEELEDLDGTIKKMNNTKQVKTNNQVIDDFHIRVFTLGRIGQSYQDVMNMPYKVFLKVLKDFEIINWSKEYDPKRNSNRLDSKALKSAMGWQVQI